MKNDIILKPLKLEEAIHFANLCKQTFRETYPNEFSEADLEVIFGADYLKRLPEELMSNYITYILAYRHETIVGYAKLIYQKNDEVVLDKFYLLKAYQGRGYGKQILLACCREAAAKHKKNILLTVWEKNKSALAFYEKKYHFKRLEKIELTFGEKIFKDYVLINDIASLLKNC